MAAVLRACEGLRAKERFFGIGLRWSSAPLAAVASDAALLRWLLGPLPLLAAKEAAVKEFLALRCDRAIEAMLPCATTTAPATLLLSSAEEVLRMLPWEVKRREEAPAAATFLVFDRFFTSFLSSLPCLALLWASLR